MHASFQSLFQDVTSNTIQNTILNYEIRSW